MAAKSTERPLWGARLGLAIVLAVLAIDAAIVARWLFWGVFP